MTKGDKRTPASAKFKPIDPDYKLTKTIQQLAADHPEWKGLQQHAEMCTMLEAQGTADRIAPGWRELKH